MPTSTVQKSGAIPSSRIFKLNVLRDIGRRAATALEVSNAFISTAATSRHVSKMSVNERSRTEMRPVSRDTANIEPYNAFAVCLCPLVESQQFSADTLDDLGRVGIGERKGGLAGFHHFELSPYFNTKRVASRFQSSATVLSVRASHSTAFLSASSWSILRRLML